ncbi:hypothetical protein [Actinoplanes auranticolor]|uniref:Uncharacterized protein n=1 Tax=Actinoplanes auranticolor TaxID=47988 RepID=A0A919VNE1_9ACTN|nr:hypothetical protein [Actinoplanes auranticolor]GIM70046.1 hypothetical protein Aau02nite_39180 [Actinoplanes auranticolor]
MQNVPPGPRTDRRRDLAGWLLTPLMTLVLGPAVAASVGLLMVLWGGLGEVPEVCAETVADNRCEEISLEMVSQHIAVFGVLWLALWLLPWWRELRGVRTGIAVLACVVLVAAPLRMN